MVMPSLQQKRRAYYKTYAQLNAVKKAEYNKQYYSHNIEKARAVSRVVYHREPEKKKTASRALHRRDPEKRREAFRALYWADPEKRKAACRALYRAEPERKKAACRALYRAEPERKKAACRALYRAEPERKKAACRALYRAEPERKKAACRALYRAEPERKKAASRIAYATKPEIKKAAARVLYEVQSFKKKAASRAYFSKKHSNRLMSFRKYHCCHKNKICLNKRTKYRLTQVKPVTIEMSVKRLQANLLCDSEAKSQLFNKFKKQSPYLGKCTAGKVKTLCQLVARKLVNKALNVRKMSIGTLFKAVRCIKSMCIKEQKDFGDGCHTASTEPYFYEAAYQLVKRDTPIPVNEWGKCVVAREITSNNCKQWHKWECSNECKPISECEVDTILALKAAFELPVEEVRAALATCDYGCPYGHYAKLEGSVPVDRKGHSIVCYSGSECTSQLRILRAASTHFPVLRQFLHEVYNAIASHKCILVIDEELSNGNYKKLMSLMNIERIDSLISNDVDSKYELCTGNRCADSDIRRPDLETQLMITYSVLITELEKQIYDFPEHACCCCERLHQRKSVSVVRLSDDFNSDVWAELKCHIMKSNPDAGNQVLYMCNYCKPMIRRDMMPPRCVLNGLQTVPIPRELAVLDQLSRQLIQLAKCYQTIVRLGTYTGKVPAYNSLKACKGTMFFLPLPLNKTLETIQEAAESQNTALPDPELYIIVNGRPTKSKVVWRSLVNVHHIKAAINTLRSCNWLYKSVQDSSVDESTKHIIEVANNSTSKMLEKASDNEIDAFQAYTIRNLDNKLSTTTDVEQYKLVSVREEPINNRLQHLDVMCFPVLFPNGEFGKFHPRKHKLSHSEYIKSRLLNKDSRFRKDPQYVFYLLWQKELRQLSAGVYNLLKTTRQQSVSVSMLLDQVNTSDEHLEAHLCTMLQSVRGTKQYWFLRHSELKCMIREWGSPTLFLTFSCAEYESPDITEFLMKVNNVPPSYNIGKLCVEDPISVSRKFSLKFHAFFRKVLIKGEVLGKVDHFYWKKEYQNRGAPHYHVLLWIHDAPVIDRDEPEDVLKWIQERITCHIPDKDGSPELYRLVTRYQLHKCSKYCKRRKKCGQHSFITRCRFGFPRPVCANAALNPVQESLKSRNRIYQLTRTESEVRVNDYNPLLLMLWKANIDIQFIAEASLALAHYVSGYVTKAERSSMQEIWQEVSENKSIYSRLWSFGIRSLRFRECGLYEASDLLLGDHLTEKSATVKWVDASMPHKRSHRLKDHSKLQEMAKTNPNNKDIFEDNLIDTFYPQRPSELEDVCLYDFVANYELQGLDKHGKRQYRKLTKPKLPNHKLFDPDNENQREEFFYSLVLLFSPFRDESGLLYDKETAEQAFQRLLSNKVSDYHDKLKTMLAAASNVKKINDARQKEGQEEKVEEDDDPQLIGEANTAMTDVLTMNINSSDKLSVEERVALLNDDQRRVFDTVKGHLLHQKCHEQNECFCDIKPVRMFVSGVGGTGKSFLIEAIKALVISLWPLDDLVCAIAAPTGLAAFNVGGTTIHRLFQLPIEHSAKAASYWCLPKSSQKVMKTTLCNVKLFIIDEISMVSSLNLAYIHMRLEELFGEGEWFGSRNMLFVGDLLQLQPVSGSPVFEKVSTKSLVYQLGCAASINIWKDSVVYDELTINERQKADKRFSSMLDCVRRGCPTDETLCTLKERVIQVSIADKFNELQKSGKIPVCLFPKRKACDNFNAEMLQKLTSKVHELVCTDEIDETASARKMTKKAIEHLDKLNSDCNMTAGLEAKLSLAVGARVMLRRNIDTKAGLVNGAIGTVLAITARHVTVQFDHISTPYNVEMVKSRFMVMKHFYVYRKQFPLILAYAVTIHKCQGLSLDCAIVDLSDEVFSEGMAYVALSRVRSLTGLYLSAFNPQSIMVSTKCLKEVNRLRLSFRNDLPLYDIPVKSGKTTKRKLTAITTSDEPRPKRSI